MTVWTHCSSRPRMHVWYIQRWRWRWRWTVRSLFETSRTPSEFRLELHDVTSVIVWFSNFPSTCLESAVILTRRQLSVSPTIRLSLWTYVWVDDRVVTRSRQKSLVDSDCLHRWEFRVRFTCSLSQHPLIPLSETMSVVTRRGYVVESWIYFQLKRMHYLQQLLRTIESSDNDTRTRAEWTRSIYQKEREADHQLLRVWFSVLTKAALEIHEFKYAKKLMIRWRVVSSGSVKKRRRSMWAVIQFK